MNFGEPEISVLKNRQQRIERERDQSRRRTDADKRNQQPQHSQRRNGLQHAGKLQHRFRLLAAAGKPYRQRHRNRHRAHQRQQRNQQMFQRGIEQLGFTLQQRLQNQIHNMKGSRQNIFIKSKASVLGSMCFINSLAHSAAKL